MRFLGPNADANDEIPKYQQIPAAGSVVLTDTMTVDDSFGTSLTTMDLSLALTPGLWAVEYMLSWTCASSTNVSLRFTFDGVENSAQFWMIRIAGAAGLAASVGHVLNTTYGTSSTIPHTAQVRGSVNVTTGGTLGLQMLRAASSSGTLEKASFIRASKV